MGTAGRNTVLRRTAALGVLGVVVLAGAGSAAAHDGGTDANGCHAGPEPYHCHTSSTAGAGAEATDTQAPSTTVVLPVQTSAPVTDPGAGTQVQPEVAGITAEQQVPAETNPELAYTGATEWLLGAVAGILLVLGFVFRSYGLEIATTANIRRHDRHRADVDAFRRRIDEIKERQSGW